jgi:formylglycine-generating enzyme required for sulfatase activity
MSNTVRHIPLLILILCIQFISTCAQDDNEFIHDNPFDPQNPITQGEPYHLRENTTDIIGNKNKTVGGIHLQWDVITGFNTIIIYRSTTQDSGFVKIGTSSTTGYIDSTTQSGVTYYYQIRASNNEKEAQPSLIIKCVDGRSNITATTGEGGSISPSGNVKVAKGSSQSFNISPNVGYSILDVKVDGVSKGNISSYIFSNVTTDHTIKASFISIINTFTITATAENGGSISPSGNVKVAKGSSQSFNISPNAGYSILDVQIDGKSIGKMDRYTFDNITTNHQIKAIFEMIPKNPDITGMVLIPAGEFQMGDSFNEGEPDELPVHTVYLDAFYIDKYEVTNAEYRKFVQATGHKEPEGGIYVNGNWVWGKPWQDKNYNGDNQPVMCVTWADAKAYADWTGKRLPTEAEWEKSARDGLVGKRYPWGDDISYDNANYWEKGRKDVWTYTSPVGSFAPNGYGLYDIAGNVWEWCSDWYGNNYYVISIKSNPTGPGSGSYRVLRGGSWNSYDSALRVSNRDCNDPASAYDDVGFRCVSGLSVTP